jgi:hypothetical protein
MKYLYVLFWVVFIQQCLQAQVQFSDYFSNERLRFDYVAAGSATSLTIYPCQFYKEPFWGGSYSNLIDTFRFGEMMLEVFDSLTGSLIYSRGYSTLFKEWQTTDEAITNERAYSESVFMPFPKRTVNITILERTFNQQFAKVTSLYINPSSLQIIHIKQPGITEVRKILINGDPGKCTDIVFIGEGYRSSEKDKFFSDVLHFKDLFFQWEPYTSLQNEFNIYAVYASSDESGTDDPADSVWVNTLLESSLNTFGSERYLTVTDIPRMRNLIAGIPYDQVCIMVNSPIYGGGGIYNFFTVFTSDNKNSEFLFQHEFGHAFASLADEYYTSQVSYKEMFNPEVEPYQPNITTRIHFEQKWGKMIPDTIPVPTPDTILYKNVVGLFEGAAYSAKGIYRPSLDCSMKSIVNNAFCPVCRNAIRNMVFFNGYYQK